MGLLTGSNMPASGLVDTHVAVDIESQDGTLIASTSCKGERSLTVVENGNISSGVYGGTGQWTGNCAWRLGDEVSFDLFRSGSDNRFRFYLAGRSGSDYYRVPIGTLAIVESGNERRKVRAELVGLESNLSNSRIPSQIDLYPSDANKKWTSDDTAFWLAHQADADLAIDGDSNPRRISAQVEQPAFPEIFEQGTAWWSVILETVTPYGKQPYIDRLGQFSINYPVSRPIAGVAFAFDDSSLSELVPSEDTFTPVGAVVASDFAEAGQASSEGSAWMSRESSASPNYADSRDPIHSTYSAPTTADFNVTGATSNELSMMTESLSGLFDPSDFVSFTTSDIQVLDIGQIGWIKSDFREIDSMYRIIEVRWSWDDGGRNPKTSFQAQRVTE